MSIELTPVARLSRDLRAAAGDMQIDEARFLVDAYYAMQRDRIRDGEQMRALGGSGEPTAVLSYLGEQHRVLETQIAGALKRFAEAQPIGAWMLSIVGIGPIIAAGMIAHIDIHKAQTASQIWRYAGLDPTVRWEKGKKRPWNASLKVLCWKAGESFVKTQNAGGAVYGPMYVERKALETARNEAGENAATAARILTEKRFGADTEARKHLEAGRLPPAQIHARARRYAVKMFLAHLHETWRGMEGLPVPEPYAIAHLKHAHRIGAPS